MGGFWTGGSLAKVFLVVGFPAGFFSVGLSPMCFFLAIVASPEVVFFVGFFPVVVVFSVVFFSVVFFPVVVVFLSVFFLVAFFPAVVVFLAVFF